VREVGGVVSMKPKAHEKAAASRADRDVAGFAEDVHFYLSQRPRQLPSRYLYDPLGSALFDAICHLPWYRITRAESSLLAAHAPEILSIVDPVARIVELGPGSGEKLAVLLGARAPRPAALDVHLIDVSKTALEAAARALSAIDGVRVVTHEATYETGVDDVSRAAAGGGGTLTLFLGSNVGNFDPPSADALLRHVRMCLRPGDALLLGADLVKPEQDLLLAYDDPLGVTAAFNRNLLVRVNRELGGDFDLDAFAHRALWNAEDGRVEMHLVSRRAQRVRVAAAGIDIALGLGESIWTESSYKHDEADVRRTLARAGFMTRALWIDEDARFALTLAGVSAT
jgi:L-histidine N-alpha-methyltransferase